MKLLTVQFSPTSYYVSRVGEWQSSYMIWWENKKGRATRKTYISSSLMAHEALHIDA
jgi:hypothetical protein